MGSNKSENLLKTQWARMRRVQNELEINKKLLSEKTTEKERNQSDLNREIEEANASYENYEYQIQSLKSANLELIEKIEPIEKEHTFERNGYTTLTPVCRAWNTVPIDPLGLTTLCNLIKEPSS